MHQYKLVQQDGQTVVATFPIQRSDRSEMMDDIKGYVTYLSTVALLTTSRRLDDRRKRTIGL